MATTQNSSFGKCVRTVLMLVNGGGAGNRTRVRAGFFRPSTCVAAISLSRPPHYVQHFAVAAQLLFGFPPVSVTETIGESPSDVRPQFGDTLG
jgi:hypothetical protein